MDGKPVKLTNKKRTRHSWVGVGSCRYWCYKCGAIAYGNNSFVIDYHTVKIPKDNLSCWEEEQDGKPDGQIDR